MNTKKERHKIIPEVYIVLQKNNKILLMLRQNTGFMDGFYGLPSGHVELYETPVGAIIREAQEEVGIQLQQSNLKSIHTLYRLSVDKQERVGFFFTMVKWKGNPQNKEPHKCQEISWFSVNQLPHNLMPYLKTILTHIDKKVAYSELIENPKKHTNKK